VAAAQGSPALPDVNRHGALPGDCPAWSPGGLSLDESRSVDSQRLATASAAELFRCSATPYSRGSMSSPSAMKPLDRPFGEATGSRGLRVVSGPGATVRREAARQIVQGGLRSDRRPVGRPHFERRKLTLDRRSTQPADPCSPPCVHHPPVRTRPPSTQTPSG
jgi:hypothetical protein